MLYAIADVVLHRNQHGELMQEVRAAGSHHAAMTELKQVRVCVCVHVCMCVHACELVWVSVCMAVCAPSP